MRHARMLLLQASWFSANELQLPAVDLSGMLEVLPSLRVRKACEAAGLCEAEFTCKAANEQVIPELDRNACWLLRFR